MDRMDKVLKIALAVIIILLITILLYNIFGSNKTLNDDIKNLKQTVKGLDTAMSRINYSANSISNIESRMDSLARYTQNERTKADVIDADRQQSMNQFNQNLYVVSNRINDLRSSIKALDQLSNSVIPVDTLK